MLSLLELDPFVASAPYLYSYGQPCLFPNGRDTNNTDRFVYLSHLYTIPYINVLCAYAVPYIDRFTHRDPDCFGYASPNTNHISLHRNTVSYEYHNSNSNKCPTHGDRQRRQGC